MFRTELNIEADEACQIETTPYFINGATVLIDVGQPVPAGAVLTEV